jgi:ribosome-associated translation inhibitor RaiA
VDRKIQISKLPKVDEIDRAKLDGSLAKSYDKLKKLLNNDIFLKAHFKDFQRAGSRKNHSVQLHLSLPGLELSSSATDWNLITALQEALGKLEREAEKKIST